MDYKKKYLLEDELATVYFKLAVMKEKNNKDILREFIDTWVNGDEDSKAEELEDFLKENSKKFTKTGIVISKSRIKKNENNFIKIVEEALVVVERKLVVTEKSVCKNRKEFVRNRKEFVKNRKEIVRKTDSREKKGIDRKTKGIVRKKKGIDRKTKGIDRN